MTIFADDLLKQRDQLLDAAKYALKVIAEYNAGGTIETAQQMWIAQHKLFDATLTADPEYYGRAKTNGIAP